MSTKQSLKSSHDVDRVAAFLEARAKESHRDRAPIFYNQLATELDFPSVDQYWLSHPLCGIFETLDVQDVESGRPLRTALVVNKEFGLPGEGFFKTMARLRGARKPATDVVQRMTLWTEELDRLLKFYQHTTT